MTRSHPTPARRSVRRVLPAVVGLVLTAPGLTACSAPGGGAITTNDVACAAVLPLASATVRDRGTLLLIRRIGKDDSDTLTREAGVVPPPPRPPGAAPPRRPPEPHPAEGPPPPKACLVVYRGDYPPGAVPGASPPAVSGHYALVVLRVRHPAVSRILVTETLPADTVPRPWWRRIF